MPNVLRDVLVLMVEVDGGGCSRCWCAGGGYRDDVGCTRVKLQSLIKMPGACAREMQLSL